jgi:hypothetical protein
MLEEEAAQKLLVKVKALKNLSKVLLFHYHCANISDSYKFHKTASEFAAA